MGGPLGDPDLVEVAGWSITAAPGRTGAVRDPRPTEAVHAANTAKARKPAYSTGSRRFTLRRSDWAITGPPPELPLVPRRVCNESACHAPIVARGALVHRSGVQTTG